MSEVIRFGDPRQYDNGGRSFSKEVTVTKDECVIVNRFMLLSRVLVGQQGHKHIRLGIYFPARAPMMVESEMDSPGYEFPVYLDSDKVESRLFLPTERGRLFAGYQYEMQILSGGGRDRPIRVAVGHTYDIKSQRYPRQNNPENFLAGELARRHLYT